MRLPNGERCVVKESKVRDYLVSAEHPIGRFKAAFFRALGYTESNCERLVSELRAHGNVGEAVRVQVTTHGRKYEVRAILSGPLGKEAELVTVWIVPSAGDVPRLVTAYPGRRP